LVTNIGDGVFCGLGVFRIAGSLGKCVFDGSNYDGNIICSQSTDLLLLPSSGSEDFLFQVDVQAVKSAAFLQEVEAVLAVGSAGFVWDVPRVTSEIDFFASCLS